MTLFATSQRTRLGLGILAACLALTLGLVLTPQAHSREFQPPPSYKFTVKNGNYKTDIKVTVANGRITTVSGTNSSGTFKFKTVRAGEKSKVTGGRGQTRKCAGLRPGNDLKWTFCFYVDGGSNPTAAWSDYLFEIETIDGESGDGGGGGGGGGGTPSHCWEDEKLQMTICDP